MSRIENLKKQHPDLNITLFDIITAIDPTGTYKYTEFLIKQLKKNELYSSNPDEFKGYLAAWLFQPNSITILNEFERHSKNRRIKETDISKYEDFNTMYVAIKEAIAIEEEKKSEKQIKKIYWTDEWSVLIPLTHLASKRYGSNTTWCTTQLKYWKKYLNTHKLIYVINKKTGFKVAFSRELGNRKGFSAWSEDDIEVSPLYFDLPDEIFLKIKKELKKEESTNKIAKDFGIIDLENETLVKDFKISPTPDRIVASDTITTTVSDITSYNGYDYQPSPNMSTQEIMDYIINQTSNNTFVVDDLP